MQCVVLTRDLSCSGIGIAHSHQLFAKQIVVLNVVGKILVGEFTAKYPNLKVNRTSATFAVSSSTSHSSSVVDTTRPPTSRPSTPSKFGKQ
jgi:hypothetical protein